MTSSSGSHAPARSCSTTSTSTSAARPRHRHGRDGTVPPGHAAPDDAVPGQSPLLRRRAGHRPASWSAPTTRCGRLGGDDAGRARLSCWTSAPKASSSCAISPRSTPVVHLLQAAGDRAELRPRQALANRDTRRALNLAVNRAELVSRASRARGCPADMPVWPPFWAFDASPPCPFDPAGRREDPGPSESRSPSPACCRRIRRSSSGSRCSFSGSCGRSAWTCGSRLCRRRTLFDRVGKGDFDAVHDGSRWAVPTCRSSTGSGTRPTRTRGGTSSATERRGRRALDDMRGAANDERSESACAQFVTAMRDDPPAIFLVWPTVCRPSAAGSCCRRMPTAPTRRAASPAWRLREGPR